MFLILFNLQGKGTHVSGGFAICKPAEIHTHCLILRPEMWDPITFFLMTWLVANLKDKTSKEVRHACGKWKEGVCSECRGKWRQNQKGELPVAWSSLTERLGLASLLCKSGTWGFQSQLRWEYLSFNNERVQMACEVQRQHILNPTASWEDLQVRCKYKQNETRATLWWKGNSAYEIVGSTQYVSHKAPLWHHKLAPKKQVGRITDHWQLLSIGRAHPLFPKWEITMLCGIIWWEDFYLDRSPWPQICDLKSQEQSYPAVRQKSLCLIHMVSLANLLNSKTSQCFCLVWCGNWGDYSKVNPPSAAPQCCVTSLVSAPSLPVPILLSRR